MKKYFSYAPDRREEIELLSGVSRLLPFGRVFLVASEQNETSVGTSFPIVADCRVLHGFGEPKFDAALVWSRPSAISFHKDANRPASLVTYNAT